MDVVAGKQPLEAVGTAFGIAEGRAGDGRVPVIANHRSNVEHGHGGPPDPDVCYDVDETTEALAGLETETARAVERTVETDEGPRTALDTLVIARRPTGG